MVEGFLHNLFLTLNFILMFDNVDEKIFLRITIFPSPSLFLSRSPFLYGSYSIIKNKRALTMRFEKRNASISHNRTILGSYLWVFMGFCIAPNLKLYSDELVCFRSRLFSTHCRNLTRMLVFLLKFDDEARVAVNSDESFVFVAADVLSRFKLTYR